MSTSTISNVFFLFPTQPKKKISTVNVRRFPPHPSNPRLLSSRLRFTAAGSSVAARGSSTAEGSGGGSKRTEGSGGKRPAVAPGGSSTEEFAFIARVVFGIFVMIAAYGITFIALVVYLGLQALVKIAAIGIGFIVMIAACGIGLIVLVVWLGYQTSMTLLSKIANVGEIWTWEHIVGCKGLDSEQIRALRSAVHPVLTQHPSTLDVESRVELAFPKYDQPERMVRFTCKILAQDINAFHKVEEELLIGMKQLAERVAAERLAKGFLRWILEIQEMKKMSGLGSCR